MRKGRSQRKTRGSLPPTSKRPLSRVDARAPAGSGGGAGGPQVIVGLTAPRSDDGGESRAPVESHETLETRAEGREAGAREHALELVREQSLELVRESLEVQQEPPQPAEGEEQDSYLAESVEPPPVESAPVAPPAVEPTHELRLQTLTFAPPAAFQDAADDEPVNVRATETVKTSRQMTVPTPDEMSIPPVGDLDVAVEPIADRFFSEGELVAARAEHDSHHEDWDEPAHKSVRKSLPEVVQRRARFAKYVRWAVGGAAVVCLAALARTALPPSAPAGSSLTSLEARATSGSSTASIETPVLKAAAADLHRAPAEPTRPGDGVTAPVAAVPAEAPVVEAVKAAEPIASATAAEPAVAPAAVSASGDKTALEEKKASQHALERGKLADAIAAGERSVALDPTDGEAWLLLGAAYQEKGNTADARRCYSSCIKEGKRGPIGECRAMVR